MWTPGMIARWAYVNEAWRVRALRFATLNLKWRIIALDGVPYPGYGFHYAQLPTLKSTIALMREPFPTTTELWKPSVCRARLQVQAAAIARAEKAIRKNAK